MFFFFFFFWHSCSGLMKLFTSLSFLLFLKYLQLTFQTFLWKALPQFLVSVFTYCFKDSSSIWLFQSGSAEDGKIINARVSSGTGGSSPSVLFSKKLLNNSTLWMDGLNYFNSVWIRSYYYKGLFLAFYIHLTFYQILIYTTTVVLRSYSSTSCRL